MIHRNDHRSYKFSLPKMFTLTELARVGSVVFTIFREAVISTTELVWSPWLLADWYS